MTQTTSVRCRWLVRLTVPMLLIMLMVFPAEAADWDGALNALVAGMKQEADSIDISAYDIPVSMLSEKYFEAADLGYFPWYVDDINITSAYYYTYYTKSGFVATVSPTYLDRTKYNRNVYEAKVNEILDKAIDEDMSQVQMALSLHDYIITHCEYDYRFFENRDSANFYGYDALVDGLAVCEGYSRAYMDLLRRVGIPAVRVLSSSMDHTWNMVQLDGEWYHVDTTWDDPSFYEEDVEGHCSHDYFLISDGGMLDSKHNHNGWIRYYSCTDARYESGQFWNDNDSAIVLPDSEYSFLSRSDYYNTNLYIRDSYTGSETLIFTSENPGAFNGMLYHSYGLSYDNGYVYCCDNQNVYAVSPDGKSAFVVYRNSSSDRCIVGCFVENGTLKLTTRDFNDNYQTTSVSIALPNDHRHIYAETKIASNCRSMGYSRYACSCGSVFAAGFADTASEHVFDSGYTVTAEPDFGVSGERRLVCTICGSEVVQTLDDLNLITSEFEDVASSKFYYEPVLWAYSRGVTNGTADGVFSPDKTCTRGQVVTFLWRAMGEPVPDSASNPFTDVKENSYYYTAVLWAVENGITNGMTATTFEPNGSCTRGQVVTFLNRAAGSLSASDERCEFQDVKESAYYYESMLWAVEARITNGITSTAFEPGTACSRGQIVTFLHRYLTD